MYLIFQFWETTPILKKISLSLHIYNKLAQEIIDRIQN